MHCSLFHVNGAYKAAGERRRNLVAVLRWNLPFMFGSSCVLGRASMVTVGTLVMAGVECPVGFCVGNSHRGSRVVPGEDPCRPEGGAES